MTYKSRAARQMGINKKLANAGEERAISRLRSIGVFMPQEIGTPFVLTKRFPSGLFRGYWKKKVIGDISGHNAKGIAVLAEVKTILDRNIRWSDLKDHQIRFLTQHAERAISLLVWVHHSNIYIMNWRALIDSGFGAGRGITQEQAEKLNIEKI